ncbi:MAG: hypothetical protein AAFW75_30785 [Cyanobacteria bacterium J06636_16]
MLLVTVLLSLPTQLVLACPYHGNKVQFLGDGRAIVEGNLSGQAIQQVLPLQVIDGLVWTYGLRWQEIEGKSVAEPIEPKLPIPDYSNVLSPSKSQNQLHLKELNHIYSQSVISECNILQLLWNIHDGEHFSGTHRNTMLTQKIAIDNLAQDENRLSWQLIMHKRGDRGARWNKMSGSSGFRLKIV